jgi:diguanylate cyclase (GGDEF)-like protein
MTQPITLAALEQLLRARDASFPAPLQAAYEDDRRRFLEVAARTLMPRTIIGYNLFLPIDIWLLPKTAGLTLALHLAVVTPFMIYAALLIRRESRPEIRDAVLAFVPILITLQIMLIFRLNTGQNAWCYQYLAILVMVYTNISQILGFRFALFASAGTMLLYLAAVLTSAAPEPVKIISCALMLSTGYLSLESKAALDRGNRNQFLRRLRERLQRYEAEDVASRDALTGLSNRRHLDERIETIWAAKNPAQKIAFVMIDIDHFKLFNDEYGHPAGDHCLKRVAGAISSVLRGQDDLAVRFGGEEFVLLLPDTNVETAIQIAERVRRAIESLAIPHAHSPTGHCVTASLGVAAGTAAEDSAALIIAADEALYAAKRNGRNQVHPPFMALEAKPAKVRRSAG